VVAQREDIGGVAVLLYGVIANRVQDSRYDHPGIRTLQHEVRKGWETVKRGLAELVAAGLIRISPRGNGRSAVYSLGPAAPQTAIEIVAVTAQFPLAVTAQEIVAVTAQFPLAVTAQEIRAVTAQETGAVTAQEIGAPSLKQVKQEKERETAGLFPRTLDFGTWAEKERGELMSVAVMGCVNPIFVKNVPAGYVIRMFDAHWRHMKPWDFATKVLDGWKEDKKYYRGEKGTEVGK